MICTSRFTSSISAWVLRDACRNVRAGTLGRPSGAERTGTVAPRSHSLELLLGDSLAGELVPRALVRALEGDAELAAAELLAERVLGGEGLFSALGEGADQGR